MEQGGAVKYDEHSLELAAISVSRKTRLAVAIVLFLAAGGVWYWTGRADRAFHEESIAALGDVVYRLQCSACGHKFEMPGAEYTAKAGPEGVRCVKCGADKAFRVGDVGDDPAQFREEMMQFTRVDDIQAAREATQREYDEVSVQLASPEVSADSARRTELRRKEVHLRAKLIALDVRWDELLDH